MKKQIQYQFGVTMLIQKNIFRLDVSVDDTLTVKKGQGLNNASCIKPGPAFFEKSSATVWRSLIDKKMQTLINHNISL